jgi:hypothetical protein
MLSRQTVPSFARLLVLALLSLGAFSPVSSAQTIRRLRAAIVGGLGDGSTWADAFVTPDDAIVASSDDDQIRVATGTYKPTDFVTSLLIDKRLELYRAFHGGDAELYVPHLLYSATVVDADPGVQDSKTDDARGNAVAQWELPQGEE